MKLTNSYSESVLSFFSGAGGFSYGFSQAGMLPISAAEINEDACKTYQTNVSQSVQNVDLSIASPEMFWQTSDRPSPFAVIGGPPCQGFSTAGARDNNDPRNKLIFNYLKIVENIKPRWFIFENVEGLLTSGNGIAVSSLVKEFIRIGYCVRVQKVNFAAYGVPQTRKRVLIIGNSLGLDFDFPDETHSYSSGKSKKHSDKPFAPTLDEALAGLGQAANARNIRVPYLSSEPVNAYDRLMRINNIENTVTDHYSNIKQSDAEIFSLLKQGQTMKDLPQEHWHESFSKRAFRRVKDGIPTEKRGGAPSGIKRLSGKYQGLTITSAATREFLHPHENRPLTIRESARIQSFPDAYIFKGNAASVIQQIGNAVPPLAAAVFARHLQNLDSKFGSDIDCGSRPKRLLGFRLTESKGMSNALKETDRLLAEIMQ